MVSKSGPAAKVHKSEDAETSVTKEQPTALSTIECLEKFIETAASDMKEIQNHLSECDARASAQYRKVENQIHNDKKVHYEKRSEIIAKNHSDFWYNIFMFHPEIELFLCFAAKTGEVEKCDLEALKCIKKVEVSINNTDKEANTTLTLFFSSDINKYFKNEFVSRTIKIDDKNAVNVQCTKLEPTQLLSQMIKRAEESSDPAQMPFVAQFVDEKADPMNEFVEAMKGIYTDPIGHLKESLEAEYPEDIDSDLSDIEEEEEDDDDDEEEGEEN
ncbi:MAG: hypothetical protein MHPSP_003235 [Paramarteilia canceri]